MKKENRQMAQERRRKEREAEARKQKTVKILVPTVVIAAIAVVVIGIILTSGKSSDSASASSAASAASASSVSTAASTSAASAASTSAASTSATSAASTAAKALNNDPMTVAEEGDTVNIDYVGTIDGVEFEGGSTDGKGTDLVLGSGTYIPGFEDQIVGHSAGETFDVTVTFPDDYGVADLAGKEAVFKTKLNGVYQ